MVTPPMTAPMKNNTALTCSSRVKLASVSVPAAISPTQATAISAESPAHRVLDRCGYSAVRGLDGGQIDRGQWCDGRTIPTASTILPGNRSVTTLNPCAEGRMSSSPNPASAGPVIRKIRGPIRAAMRADAAGEQKRQDGGGQGDQTRDGGRVAGDLLEVQGDGERAHRYGRRRRTR